MEPLKTFEEFEEAGVVIRRRPDIKRAASLIRQAQGRWTFLRELTQRMPVTEKNANYFIEASYDTLIELLRAKMVSMGLYASGVGGHEAEVSFMRVLGFTEDETQFMNGLRHSRNGIKYYGKSCSRGYALLALKFMRRLYPRLVRLVVS